MHIYLDLDGVLVNLEESFGDYFFDKLSSETWQEYEKRKIAPLSVFNIIYEKVDPYDFWYDLNPMPEYMDIVDKAIELVGVKNVSILSAPTTSYTNECSMGKIDWVRRYIPYNIKCNVVFRENKKIFSGKNKILIDDMSKNVIEWTIAGGIGILHVNNANTLSELNDIFKR